jgi:hypothetical protein
MEQPDVLRRAVDVSGDSYFPVAYIVEKSATPLLARTVQDLPKGTPFRILLTNATIEKFQLVEHLCRQLADILSSAK